MRPAYRLDCDYYRHFGLNRGDYMSSKKTYQLIRTVQETFYCDADTKEEAKKLIGLYGGPSSITIVREKITIVK